MGSGDDLRDRLWRERLVTALRLHLSVGMDEAEALADLALLHGLPPGQDEGPVRAALWRSQDATPEWVEQVMRVIQSVRDGIRLPDQAPERVESPAPPLIPQGAAAPLVQKTPDQEIVMALALERLRAVNRFHQIAPQVHGGLTNLRMLRVAVSAESDDSVRLPLLLAEWLDARREWEAQNRVFQAAQATLRATEWLVPYLHWPDRNQE